MKLESSARFGNDSLARADPNPGAGGLVLTSHAGQVVFRSLSFLRRGVVYLLPFAVLAVAATARIFAPGALDQLSLISYDLYQRTSPRQQSAEAQQIPIVVVDIDDRSLKQLGQWPWPRTMVARLIDRLREAGAGVVGFDILFSEPDRTSPALLVPLLTQNGVDEGQAKQMLASMPDPDQVLAEAIVKLPVVDGFALVSSGGSGSVMNKAGFAFAGAADQDPLQYVGSFPEAVGDLPPLQQAAAGNGFLNQYLDWDHVVRRVPLILRLGDRPEPSLVAEVLRVIQPGLHS
jgi:adenylate cyclase